MPYEFVQFHNQTTPTIVLGKLQCVFAIDFILILAINLLISFYQTTDQCGYKNGGGKTAD